MASGMLDILVQKNRVKHGVGNLNNWNVKVIPQGALVADTAIDNFTFCEIGFNAEGERICKQLTDVTKDAYLIASVERVFDGGVLGESLCDFYNAKGERARIVIPESKITRFDTSSFSLNTGVTGAKNGMVAHFDPATKKYIVSDSASAHADYATAKTKLLVVEVENAPIIDGLQTIRFEVQ